MGVPEEGVLLSPDILTSTQDAQGAGAVRILGTRRRGLGTLLLPQGDSGDWERRGPSNVSAACVSAVISGGPGWEWGTGRRGRRRGRETGWAGGWWCRLRGGVRVSSSALRPSSAGGRPLRRRIPAPSSPPPDSLSVLWSPTQELALHFQELGKRSRKLECESQENHNAQGLGDIWSTEGSGYQCRASMPPTRNTTQEVCLTHL